MADTIPPFEWIALTNRVPQAVHLGNTFDDKVKYLNRFKLYVAGLKAHKKMIQENKRLSILQKDKLIHAINAELKWQRSLDAEGPSGVSIKERLWRDAHQRPNSIEGYILKYNFKEVQRLLLQRHLRRIGQLQIVSPQQKRNIRERRQAVRRLPEIPSRWLSARAYYRKMKASKNG